MDLASMFGQTSQVCTPRRRVYGEAFAPSGTSRAGDSHLPHATDYVFEVTYNSGTVKKVIVRAISARAAVNELRRDCCGLVRFQLCAQRGTCYPF